MTAVIASAGLATPLGLGREASLARWIEPGEALSPNDRWPTDGYPRDDAGLVPGFNPRRMLPDRKAVKLMSREARLVVFAAVEACGGVDLPARLGLEPERVGAYASAGYEVSSLDDHEAMLAGSRDPDDPARLSVPRLFAEGRDLLNPITPLRILPNMGLFHAGLAIGARGAHLSLGNSPAAGLIALGEACRALEVGELEAAVVLGSDAQLEEFRAQLLVEAGVVPAMAPGEGAAALLLRPDGDGPRVLSWGMATEPVATGFGDTTDRGRTRIALYERVLDGATPDAVFSDLWGVPQHDDAELAALPDCTLLASRARIGWLGAAHGLVDAALAAELVRAGRADRILVTASGLSGDLAAALIGRVHHGPAEDTEERASGARRHGEAIGSPS